MPMQRPIVQDHLLWNQQLAEHRRALFERMVSLYVKELTVKNKDVERWRTELSGPKFGI
jgi:hypothetical protein